MASPAVTAPSPTLTLIVAATHPDMGIGLRGILPWPPLRTEMAYFARVTRRATQRAALNAVIMGRRTWDSIPPRFRPLKSRLNVVVTRQASGSAAEGESGGSEEGPVRVGSFADELLLVARRQAQSSPSADRSGVARAFVIGGAEIYKTALDLDCVERILLTRVKTHFGCDTFFPLKLGCPLSSQEQKDEQITKWFRKSHDDLNAWTGEEEPTGIQMEKDVEWEFEMWGKEGDSRAETQD